MGCWLSTTPLSRSPIPTRASWCAGTTTTAKGEASKGSIWSTCSTKLAGILGNQGPVNYTVVEKDQLVWDEKKAKEVRKSRVSKNEQVRMMLKACVQNTIKFRYIIADTWYSAAETMTFIAQKLERFFLLPLKSNRNVALSTQEKEQGQYQAVSSLELEQGRTYQVWVEQCDFPLLSLA